jgi:hypothetical protein
LRSNAKGYGDKTYWTDAQNSDTTAPSGRELYHLQFSLQAASPETFGYILALLSFLIIISDVEFVNISVKYFYDTYSENGMG